MASCWSLDIESTVVENIGTVTGSFKAHLHTVTIEVLSIRSEDSLLCRGEALHENVLGRIGWLDRVKLGLIDYEAKLLLSPYS